MLQLRDYQLKALEAIQEYLDRGEFRQLMVLATGLGKTIIFLELMRRLNQPALILVNREVLAYQTLRRIKTLFGEEFDDVGLVKASTYELDRKFTVASIQTLCRPNNFIKVFENEAARKRIKYIV